MRPCQFANVFGKPGEGIHKSRILGMATVDLVLTILLAILITWFKKWNFVDGIIVFTCLMIFSVIVHKFFCVETALTKKLLP